MAAQTRELHLFAGAGGGLQASVLLGHCVVCAVEKDPARVRVIAARIWDGCFEDFPIWDDAQTFSGAEWRGQADLVSGGVPCQPFSAAGQRRGADDERNLWPATLRIVSEVEPRMVFFETVPGMLSIRDSQPGWDVGEGGDAPGFLGTILGPLAGMGFDLRWMRLSAAALGATHKRDRLWIYGERGGVGLADSERDGPQGLDAGGAAPRATERGGGGALGDPDEGRRDRGPGARGERRGGGEPADAGGKSLEHPARLSRLDADAPGRDGAHDARGAGETLADAHARRLEGERVAQPARLAGARRDEPDGRDGADVADADLRPRHGLHERLEPGHAEAVARRGGAGPEAIPLWPPGHQDLAAWQRVLAIDPGLAPALAAEPRVRRLVDGLVPGVGGPRPARSGRVRSLESRVSKLAALGDGQVPAVAAAAFLYLSGAVE